MVLLLALLPYIRSDQARTTFPVVLAQDAAGPARGKEGLHTGAFCLALGRFATAEISRTLRRRETRSKIAAPVSLLHLTPELVAAQRTEGTLGRTIPLLQWFVTGADWTLVLARRWRWPLAIHVAEARATVIWMRLVVAAGLDFRALAGSRHWGQRGRGELVR